MPKVFKQQKEHFETSELFRRLARDSEIKYVGHKDRPLLERQRRCAEGCRTGKADIAFLSCGINLSLRFFPPEYDSPIPPIPYVDFEVEPGKVHFIAPLIFNGVCVNVKGYINLNKLDGSARFIYDPDRAEIEAEKEKNPPDLPEPTSIDNNEKTGKDKNTNNKDRTITLPNDFTPGKNLSTTTSNFNQAPATNSPPSNHNESNSNPFASGLSFSQQLSNSMSQLGGYSHLGLAGLGNLAGHHTVGGVTAGLHHLANTNLNTGNATMHQNLTHALTQNSNQNLSNLSNNNPSLAQIQAAQHNFMTSGLMSAANNALTGTLSSNNSNLNLNLPAMSQLATTSNLMRNTSYGQSSTNSHSRNNSLMLNPPVSSTCNNNLNNNLTISTSLANMNSSMASLNSMVTSTACSLNNAHTGLNLNNNSNNLTSSHSLLVPSNPISAGSNSQTLISTQNIENNSNNNPNNSNTVINSSPNFGTTVMSNLTAQTPAQASVEGNSSAHISHGHSWF